MLLYMTGENETGRLSKAELSLFIAAVVRSRYCAGRINHERDKLGSLALQNEQRIAGALNPYAR